MSTKIYNGFRFVSRDFGEVHALVQDFRARLTEMHRSEVLKLMVISAVERLDGIARGVVTSKEVESPLGASFESLLDRIENVRKTKRRDPAVDFDFEVWLLPNAAEGGFLAIVNTERREWHALWAAMPGVEDYAFWDSDAPDESVTSEEWMQRGETWNRVLGPRGVPSDCCWTSELTDFNTTLNFLSEVDEAAVAKFLPDFEWRVSRGAGSEALAAWMRAIEPLPANDEGRWLGMMDFRKDIKAGGRAADMVREAEERLRGMLKREVTLQDLRASPASEATQSPPTENLAP